jgi:polyhydroxybutyrate depolymerase
MRAPHPWLAVVAAHSLAFALAIAGARADEPMKLTHQGIERIAVLRQAAGAAIPAPLVIALHGRGQTGQILRGWLKLDMVADREGFALLYPEAVDRAWSYGRPVDEPMPAVGGDPVDDTGFIARLADDLVARGIADQRRIYVVGASRGGMMAFTLTCALADRIAAAAPLIGSMTEGQRADCRPARPVPLMMLASVNDPVTAYDGWLFPKGRQLSVPETMEFWRTLHGCARQDFEPLPQRVASDRTRVALVEWTGCSSGARLLLYRVSGGGHELPTMVEAEGMPAPRWGLRNHDIETAEVVWAYFKGYAR